MTRSSLALALPTVALAALASLMTACADLPYNGSLAEAMERPAEHALVSGLRAYEDANYAEAEKQLNLALQSGLQSYKDRAAAHKHLAFIYCTSKRSNECEAAFRAARLADPNFALSKSESGHPQWGSVYNRTRL
jgi:Tfp pilus assembly protein PilF